MSEAPAAPATPAAATPNAAPNANGKAPVQTGGVATPVVPNPEATEEIKFEGKVYKVTPTQLRMLAQKGFLADQRIKSVDALKSSTENLLQDLRTPEGLLKVLKNPQLGNSPKEVFRKLMMSDIIDDELKEEMSRWVYDNVVVQSKKTPQEIENEKKLSDYEKLKKEKADRELAELTAKQQAQVKQIYQAIRTEVVKQVMADKDFPQTEETIRLIVQKMRVMNRKGAAVTSANLAKAKDLVKKDLVLHQQAILDADNTAPDYGERLIARIGEARALAISKALVARHLKKQEAPIAKKEDGGEKPREKTTERIDKKLGRTPQGFEILNV